jgi:hypothetical protein
MAGQKRAPALRRMASILSLGVAFVLIGIKFWAWIATGSVAMLTSAIDALVDAAAGSRPLPGCATHNCRQIRNTAGVTAKPKRLRP